MVQLLLFSIALAVVAYGAYNGSLPSLLIGTATTLLAATRLLGQRERQIRIKHLLTKLTTQYDGVMLSALALIFAGLAVHRSWQDVFDFRSGYYWFSGLLCIIGAGYRYDHALKVRLQASATESCAKDKPAWQLDRLDWLFMGSITAIALYLRLYQLSDFLPTMHGDEGEMGMMARLALHGPASGISPLPLPLFATAFLDHPTLFHYVQAAALWLFGESLQGLRILSVIFGALCVPVVYRIGRLGWGRIAGITAGWLLAVSHFHLHYSRIALNNIETVWFTALFILLMMVAAEKTEQRDKRGWRKKKKGEEEPPNEENGPPLGTMAPLTPYLWAGLTMGISQYFYYGSRLIPVLAAPLLLLLWVKRRLSFAQVLMLTVATLVAYAPLAGYYWQNLPAFLNRTQGVSIISPSGLAHLLGPQAVWPRDIPQLIGEQIRRNIVFFVKDGDRSSFYLPDVGAFDPITVALFWLGLGVVLARLRRFHEFAIFSWFSLGLLFAGVLTNDAPNGPRLVVITTAVYVIGGILCQRLFNFSQRIWPIGTRWGSVLIGVGLAISTWQINFTTYFETYKSYSPNLLPISLAHDMHDLGKNAQVYLFGAPAIYAEYGVLRFVAQDITRFNGETAAQLPAIEEIFAAGQSLLVIALPHRQHDLDEVIARFPGGVQEERRTPNGVLLYLMYRLPAPGPPPNEQPASTLPQQSLSPLVVPDSPLLPTATSTSTP